MFLECFLSCTLSTCVLVEVLGWNFIIEFFVCRKITIIEFATKARQQFVRLLALVKWAASAERVDKCQVCYYFENVLEIRSISGGESPNPVMTLYQLSLIPIIRGKNSVIEVQWLGILLLVN